MKLGHTGSGEKQFVWSLLKIPGANFEAPELGGIKMSISEKGLLVRIVVPYARETTVPSL